MNSRISGGLIFLASLWATQGCAKRAGEGGTSADARPLPLEAAAEARQHYQESHFELTLLPKGEFRAGQVGEAEVRLVARSPFHINQQYPHRLKLGPSPGLQFAASQVGKELAKIGEQEALFPVSFTPEGAGASRVLGQLSFSVCTDEQCRIEKRDLALSIHVD